MKALKPGYELVTLFERADVGQVVQTDVLGAALLGREDAELPFRAVHRLVVGAVRVLQRDLPVVLAVADQERHVDLFDHPVEVDLSAKSTNSFRSCRRGSPHPQHVFPVVRHRPLPFALQPAALHCAPVVVRAPGDDQRQPLLERGGPRGVITAERPADHPDPRRVDVVPGLQVVHASRCPGLGVDAGGQALQPQRLTGSGRVDHQGGDAAGGELGPVLGVVHVLLGGVQPVEHDHHRGGAISVAGAALK